MSTNAVAAMLSEMLYQRRFFPLWTYNVVGGLDEQGLYLNLCYFKSNTDFKKKKLWGCEDLEEYTQVRLAGQKLAKLFKCQ